MSLRSVRSRRNQRGFTMMEAAVSLILLVMVLSLSMTLLFSMRSFAEKTQFNVLPRASARRAVDYLSFHMSGAADLNYKTAVQHAYGQPNALVMFYTPLKAAPDVVNQASFNNFDGTETSGGEANSVTGTAPNRTTDWGDLDTDLITMATIDGAQTAKSALWPGDRTATAFFTYRAGCSDAVDPDAANLAAFQRATGWDSVTGKSGLLLIFDEAGSWDYYRIGSYVQSICANPENTIEVVGEAADYESAPSGTPDLVHPITLAMGVSYVSFRVRRPTGTDGVPTSDTPNLEQKIGLFDPVCDRPLVPGGCPAARFNPIMEGIENLQVSYVFADGTFANANGTTLGGRHVPSQAGPCPAAGGDCTFGLINGPNPANPTAGTMSTDITNVVALRVSVIARSPVLPIGARSLGGDITDALLAFRRQRPALEDSSAGPDAGANGNWYERYRLTTNILLRNRNLRY